MCPVVRRHVYKRSSIAYSCCALAAFMFLLYVVLHSKMSKLNYCPSKAYKANANRNTHFRQIGNEDGDDKVKILSDDSIFAFGRAVENVDCKELFRGNNTEINNTRTMYDSKYLTDIEPEDYVKMTSECKNFTLERRYILEPLTEEERDFPIAFSILMYRDVEQFESLLRAIYRPQNIYCIHVDLGSKDDVFKAVSAIANCFPNVHMVPQRSLVKWGEMSVLQPEIVCMKLLHKKNKLWKYFINLTGQEFPLKTNYQLVKILKAYDGANDIEGTRASKFKYRWMMRGNPPNGVILVKGGVHVIVCRAFVEYILNNQTAKDMLKWLENSTIPDETFFSSLNFSPQLKTPGSFTADGLIIGKLWQDIGMFIILGKRVPLNVTLADQNSLIEHVEDKHGPKNLVFVCGTHFHVGRRLDDTRKNANLLTLEI